METDPHQQKIGDILEQLGLHPAQIDAQQSLGISQSRSPYGDLVKRNAVVPSEVAESAPVKPAAPLVNATPTAQAPQSAQSLPRISPPSGPSSPIIRTAQGDTEAGQKEKDRLIKTGSGISQIRNPFLRGLARTGDIIGGMIMPGAVEQIPGTEEHHGALIRGAENQIKNSQDTGQKEATTEETLAKTEAEKHKPGKVDWDTFQSLLTTNNPETNTLYTPEEALRKLYQDKGLAKAPAKETKEERQAGYAKLRSQGETGALSSEDQKKFGEYKTEFSVGDKNSETYNSRILDELNVNPKTSPVKDKKTGKNSLPAEYKVLPTDTDAEAKAKEQAAKDLVSGATGQQRINISTAKPEQTDVRQVTREARTNVRKLEAEWRNLEEKTSSMDQFIEESKGGNKAAVKVVPLEGALEITTSQGTKRINRNEIEQISGAGSLFDRLHGKIGKALTGQDIPDDVLNDMKVFGKVLRKSGYKMYREGLDDEKGLYEGAGGRDWQSRFPTKYVGTLTRAQVEEQAKKNGMSVEDAIADAEKGGYQVK